MDLAPSLPLLVLIPGAVVFAIAVLLFHRRGDEWLFASIWSGIIGIMVYSLILIASSLVLGSRLQ